MILQGAIICGALMAEEGTFWTVPRLTKLFWAPYVTTCARIVNSTVNPVIYFVFNTEVRKEVYALFGRAIPPGHTAAGGRNKIKRWVITTRPSKVGGRS